MVCRCLLLRQMIQLMLVVEVCDGLHYHDEELLEHVFVGHFLCVVGQLVVVEEVKWLVVLPQLQHHPLQLQGDFVVRWIEVLVLLQQEDRRCSVVYCC